MNYTFINVKLYTLVFIIIFTNINNVSFAQTFEDLNIVIPEHYEFTIKEKINENDENKAYLLVSDKFPDVAKISLTLLISSSKMEIDSNRYFSYLEEYFLNMDVETSTFIINDKRYLFAGKNYQEWEDSGEFNHFMVAHTHHGNKTYAFTINVENEQFLGWLRNLIYDIKFIKL